MVQDKEEKEKGTKELVKNRNKHSNINDDIYFLQIGGVVSINYRCFCHSATYAS